VPAKLVTDVQEVGLLCFVVLALAQVRTTEVLTAVFAEKRLAEGEDAPVQFLPANVLFLYNLSDLILYICLVLLTLSLLPVIR